MSSVGTQTGRNLAIDRLRGSLVILMVAGNYLSGIEFVPASLKHAPGIGLTIADLVAPAFVFVIGLNFGPSFARRLEQGSSVAYRHFANRYLGLIGIGAIISAGSNLVDKPSDWGVLQALGVAGLICLLVIQLPAWARFIIGSVLLIGYQVLLEQFLLETVTSSVHGGLFGSLSWAALLILSTALADLWRSGQGRFVVGMAISGLIASLSLNLVPISKHQVSLSYVLISLTLSALTFFLVEFFSNRYTQRPGLFCWWGQNALSLYLLHLLVLSIFVSPELSWWYSQAEIWLAALQLAFILGLLSLMSFWLYRRRAKMSGTHH